MSINPADGLFIFALLVFDCPSKSSIPKDDAIARFVCPLDPGGPVSPAFRLQSLTDNLRMMARPGWRTEERRKHEARRAAPC